MTGEAQDDAYYTACLEAIDATYLEFHRLLFANFGRKGGASPIARIVSDGYEGRLRALFGEDLDDLLIAICLEAAYQIWLSKSDVDPQSFRGEFIAAHSSKHGIDRGSVG